MNRRDLIKHSLAGLGTFFCKPLFGKSVEKSAISQFKHITWFSQIDDILLCGQVINNNFDYFGFQLEYIEDLEKTAKDLLESSSPEESKFKYCITNDCCMKRVLLCTSKETFFMGPLSKVKRMYPTIDSVTVYTKDGTITCKIPYNTEKLHEKII